MLVDKTNIAGDLKQVKGNGCLRIFETSQRTSPSGGKSYLQDVGLYSTLRRYEKINESEEKIKRDPWRELQALGSLPQNLNSFNSDVAEVYSCISISLPTLHQIVIRYFMDRETPDFV